MKREFRIVIAGAVAAVLLIVGGPLYVLWDWFADHTDHHFREVAKLEATLDQHARFARVTINFMAEGQSLKAISNGVCEAKVIAQMSFPKIGRKSSQPFWIGRRLPSGAGFLFVTPNICAGPTVTQFEANKLRYPPKVFKSHLAYALWLDDVRDPTVIEEYASPTHYESLATRLRVTDVSVRPTEKLERSNPADEIEWLKKDPDLNACRIQNTDPGCVHPFRGRYITYVPETIWRQKPNVAAILDTFEKARPLNKAEDIEVSKVIRKSGYGTYGSTGAVRPALPEGRLSLGQQAIRRLFPVDVQDGRYVVKLSRPGVIIHRRAKALPKEYQLWINGEAVPAQATRRWQYDPRSKVLFYVGSSSIFERGSLNRF